MHFKTWQFVRQSLRGGLRICFYFMGNFRDDLGASRLWCGLDMNFKRTKKYGHEKKFTDKFGKAQAC